MRMLRGVLLLVAGAGVGLAGASLIARPAGAPAPVEQIGGTPQPGTGLRRDPPIARLVMASDGVHNVGGFEFRFMYDIRTTTCYLLAVSEGPRGQAIVTSVAPAPSPAACPR